MKDLKNPNDIGNIEKNFILKTNLICIKNV